MLMTHEACKLDFVLNEEDIHVGTGLEDEALTLYSLGWKRSE